MTTSLLPLIEQATTTALVSAGQMMNRTLVLPLLVFFPTSRCNSRCVSCDWWRSSGDDDLELDEISAIAAVLPSLGTRIVAFSGGEPLLRPDVFRAADLFLAVRMRLHLLTSGVLLERHAHAVASRFERVTISLDSVDEDAYHAIRGIAALRIVEAGAAKVKRIAPRVAVTARATLHRMNFRELPALIARARALGLDGISFLAADVSSQAFGRQGLAANREALCLTENEIAEFEAIVERTVVLHRDAFESRFVAESPDKLRRLPRMYAAMAGAAPFERVDCNAPWVSVVLEADGGVRPCFFHQRIGNIRQQPFTTIVGKNLPEFRRSLDIGSNPVCARCVCSIKTGWRGAPWQ